MEEMLILVDLDDNPIKPAEKLSIHQQGLLHRAFSIFLFDSNGRLLLQQRASSKYHSARLWSNSCCGHPRWGELTEAAAARRLWEEMSIHVELRKVSSFTYKADVPGNLVEFEFDHIYVGLFDGEPQVNPDEADGWRWIYVRQLLLEMSQQPQTFTVWFREVIHRAGMSGLEHWRMLASH